MKAIWRILFFMAIILSSCTDPFEEVKPADEVTTQVGGEDEPCKADCN